MVHITLLISTLIAFVKHHKKSLIAVSFGILFVFCALRYGYGNDYFSYMQNFIEIKMSGTAAHISQDILYIWLNRLMPSYQVLIAVTSFIFLLTMYLLITRNVKSEYHGIAMLIFLINPYVFLINLSSLRQTMAMCVMALAIYFSIKRKPILYLIFMIAASLFHFSAILLLPIYFLANTKKISKGFIIGFVVTLLVFMFAKDALGTIIEWFEEFITGTHTKQYIGNEGNSLRSVILTSPFLLYVLLNIRKLEGRQLAYAKLYMLAPFFGILAYHINMITRFQQYFDIFSVVAIPSIMYYNLKNEKDQILKVINGYAFPALLFVIFALRYYSFFTTEMWEPFFTYQINFTELF